MAEYLETNILDLRLPFNCALRNKEEKDKASYREALFPEINYPPAMNNDGTRSSSVRFIHFPKIYLNVNGFQI